MLAPFTELFKTLFTGLAPAVPPHNYYGWAYIVCYTRIDGKVVSIATDGWRLVKDIRAGSVDQRFQWKEY